MRSLSTSRAIAATCIALATVALVMYTTTSEQDTPAIRMEDDDFWASIVPDDMELEEAAPSKAKAKKDGDPPNVLKSLVSLRAYAELAYDKAASMKQEHFKSYDTGLINLIVLFAKKGVLARESAEDAANDAHEKSMEKTKVDDAQAIPDLPVLEPAGALGVAKANVLITYNVVTDYAKALATAKKSFSRGMGKYVLRGIDKAVMAGANPLQQFKRAGRACVGLSYKVAGFKSRPAYIKKLCVSQQNYITRRLKVEAESTGADLEAATQWLKKGGKKEYMSFKKTEEEKTKKRKKAFHKAKVAAALSGIKVAYEHAEKRTADKFLRLDALPFAGATEAGDVPVVQFRTEDEIKADAEKASKDWMHAHQNGKLKAAITHKEVKVIKAKPKSKPKGPPQWSAYNKKTRSTPLAEKAISMLARQDGVSCHIGPAPPAKSKKLDKRYADPLAPHVPDGPEVITALRLDDGMFGNMRYRMKCGGWKGHVSTISDTYHTSCVSKAHAALSRGVWKPLRTLGQIQCPGSQALQAIKLVSCSDDGVKYEYQCATAMLGSHNHKATKCADISQIQDLKHLTPACADGEAMTGFKFTPCSAGKHKYTFSCAKVVTHSAPSGKMPQDPHHKAKYQGCFPASAIALSMGPGASPWYDHAKDHINHGHGYSVHSCAKSCAMFKFHALSGNQGCYCGNAINAKKEKVVDLQCGKYGIGTGDRDRSAVYANPYYKAPLIDLSRGKKIALLGGHNGQYCSDDSNKVICNRNKASTWEVFKVDEVGKSAITLKGGQHKLYCSDTGNDVKCNRNRASKWETFTVVDAGGGKIALKGGNHGKYCSDEGNQIKCNRDRLSQWEKFQVKYM